MLVAVWAVAAALPRLLAIDATPLTVVLGLPLALFLPGYPLTALLWPGRRWEGIERIALALGLSLALAVVSGLVLNWTPWGVGGVQQTAVLALVAVGGALLALLRRGGEPAATDRWSLAAGPLLPPVRAGQLLLLALGLGLVAAAVVISARSAATAPGSGYVAAWITPAGSRPGTVSLGVDSHTASAAGYRVELLEGARTVRDWPRLSLPAGGTWSATVKLPPAASGTVLVRVYEAGQSRVLRQVELTGGTAR